MDSHAAIAAIRQIVGTKGMIEDASAISPYVNDHRDLFHGSAVAVVRPASTEETAEVVRIAADARLPIVPQGGNTGLVGGSVPPAGAQGIVLMAILGLRYDRDVQHCNAAKNMFAATANMTAAAVFLVTGRMNLAVALVLAAGAIVGGYAGGHWARQLPSAVLRTMVIIAGLVASGYLLIFG